MARTGDHSVKSNKSDPGKETFSVSLSYVVTRFKKRKKKTVEEVLFMKRTGISR